VNRLIGWNIQGRWSALRSHGLLSLDQRLVGDAGVIGARPAELVTVEIRQVVVVVFVELGKVPRGEVSATARALAL
jgi:hypothetical protein